MLGRLCFWPFGISRGDKAAYGSEHFSVARSIRLVRPIATLAVDLPVPTVWWPKMVPPISSVCFKILRLPW